jgi:hypothetical protein
MADEITVNLDFEILKDGLPQIHIQTGDVLQSLAVVRKGAVREIMNVTNSEAAIDKSQLEFFGYMFVSNRNTGSTHRIVIRGMESGANFIEVKPGEFALFPIRGSSDPYILAPDLAGGESIKVDIMMTDSV